MWGPLNKIFGPPTKEKFAKIVIGHLRRSGETRELAYIPEKFSVHIGDANQNNRIFLGNLYQTYIKADREQRAALFEAVAALRKEGSRESEPWELAKAKLLPHVRERFYHETVALMGRLEGSPILDSIPTLPFADGLVVELVIDEPQTLRIVNNKQLKEWGASFDSAISVARENLWNISNRDFTFHEPGFFISPYHDTHDASRMFLHDLIWQLPVKGDHIVMIPNRSVLMVTGSDDDDSLEAMAKLTEQRLHGERPMTGTAYRLDATRFVPFLPPRQSRAFSPLKTCAFISNLQWHAEQHDLLEQICKKQNQDCFVPKLTGMKREDGELYTWTCWVQDVTHALIPKADVIAFAMREKSDEKYRTRYADWDTVHKIAGDLLIPTSEYPPRYTARAFPTPDQLKNMNLRDTP